MILDTTTRSLEVLIEGAHTTTAPVFVAAWADTTSGSTFVPGETNGVLNGTTAVTATAAPASSAQRQVNELHLFNADTVPHTFTIQINDNGTKRIWRKPIVAAGGYFFYTPKGSDGPTGPTGPTGATGPTGPTGATGATGTVSSLTSAHILVGNVSNVATDVAMSGDITITNAGVTAIGANKVVSGMIATVISIGQITSTVNTNGLGTLTMTNPNAGTGAISVISTTNGTHFINFNMTGTNWTTSGVLRQDGAIVTTNGAGGWCMDTATTASLFFSVNRAQFSSIDGTAYTASANNTFDIGTSSVAWRNIYSNNLLNVISDKRKKTDIKPLSHATAFIMALKPCSFRMIEGGSVVVFDDKGDPVYDDNNDLCVTSRPGVRRHDGFLAQEMYEAAMTVATVENGMLDDTGNLIWAGWGMVDKDDPASLQHIRMEMLNATLAASLQELWTEFNTYKTSHP